jgi:hypothetical protein
LCLVWQVSEVFAAAGTAITSGALIVGYSRNQEVAELLGSGEVGGVGFWAPQVRDA